MSENIKNKNSAPIAACVFSQSTNVKLADGMASAGEKDHFKIVGYSGQIIPKHWYWGNLAFDLVGLTFAKAKTPVLEEHFTDKRIGFTEKQEITDKVIVEGKFLSNPNAQEIKADMLSGFPMEASLYVPPLVIEHVPENSSVQVNNGQILNGPGTIFRKAKIKEVSICVFGTDLNTSATAMVDKSRNEIEFAIFKADPNTAAADIKVTPTSPLTVKTFTAQTPEQQKKPGDGLSNDDFWREVHAIKYALDPSLQAEFSSVETYIAYMMAESKGLIGIIEHRTVKI